MKTNLHLALRPLHLTLALALLSTLNPPSSTWAQGTAFTYQGRLLDGANAANGSYSLRFTLCDAVTAGNLVSGPITNAPVAVSNGLFTVLADFGAGVFTGTNYWLQIDAASNGPSPVYTALAPRQPLTPAPCAIYAETSGSANSVVGGGGGGWNLTGNNHTTGADFVGTTDNHALDLRANNLRGLRLEPGANNTMNVLGGAWGFDVEGLDGVVIGGGGYFGGGENFVYANWGTIGGGYNNRVDAGGTVSVIGGGAGNRSSGSTGAIGGGSGNTVMAIAGTIPGGYSNVVSGAYGFAAGQQAQAVHQGAFVWADSQNVPFLSASNDQFSVRAAGGVRSETGGAGLAIDGVRVAISGGLVWQVVSGASVQAAPNTGYLLSSPQLVTVTLPGSPNPADIVRVTGAGSSGWKIAPQPGQSVLGNNLFGGVGATWTPRDSSRSWNGVASSADGTKLAAVDYFGQIHISTDSGVTWNATGPSGHLNAVASSADGTKLIVADGSAGTIYTSSDSGTTWIPQAPFGNWGPVASSADGTKLVAAAVGGQIYTSPDSGVVWYSQGPSENWRAAACSADGTRLVAVTQGDQIYASPDSGITWSPHGPAENWGGVASSADGTKLVAVAQGDQIYTSSDSGTTWSPHGPTGLIWSSVASSADGTKLVALAYNSQIYISADSGATWSPQGPTENEWLSAASSANGTKLVAVAYGGQIYTSQPVGISSTTAGSGYLLGGQNTSVELQYLGNDQFLVIGHEGAILAY